MAPLYFSYCPILFGIVFPITKFWPVVFKFDTFPVLLRTPFTYNFKFVSEYTQTIFVQTLLTIEVFDECKKLLVEKTDELIYVKQKLSHAENEIKRLSGRWYNRFLKK